MKLRDINLTDDVMWHAAIMCDAGYDGMFYYAVKSTGIFCRPSCRSKTPHRDNVVYFANAQQAMTAGYRPCKRCRPELAGRTYDPAGETVSLMQKLLETQYEHLHSMDEVAQQVGMSAFHLQRLFKQYIGMTPKEYLDGVRVKKAMHLLGSSSLNNTEICYAVGFQSPSSFYNAFRKQTGLTPTEYKDGRQEEHETGI